MLPSTLEYRRAPSSALEYPLVPCAVTPCWVREQPNVDRPRQVPKLHVPRTTPSPPSAESAPTATPAGSPLFRVNLTGRVLRASSESASAAAVSGGVRPVAALNSSGGASPGAGTSGAGDGAGPAVLAAPELRHPLGPIGDAMLVMRPGDAGVCSSSGAQ